jgi:hypothetical protein
MGEKATKADIGAIEYVFADLDPAEGESSTDAKARYWAQLKTFKQHPMFVIDSGNGIQLLWRLAVPIVLGESVPGPQGKSIYSPEEQEKIDDAEARNAAVMVKLNAKAGTQNIDRILRLPGTTNLPNAKKRREGRRVCQAKLIEFTDVAYPLEAFSPLVEQGWSDRNKAKQKTRHGEGPSIHYIKSLPEADVASLPISDKMKTLIGSDGSDYGADGDRSAALMAVLKAMAASNCTDEQMYAVMWHEPIGQHAREQSNLGRYFERQVDRAREFAAHPDATKEFGFVEDDPMISELNRNYALVLVGGRSAILRETDQEPGGYTLLSHSAFDNWFANRYVTHNNRRMALSKYWMSHPQRRQYEGVAFAPRRAVPRHYNLWRGFAVEPKPGDCSRFLAHVLDNICQGNQELFEWLMGWFAQIVQHPDQKLGTAVVLRGKEGTGKSIVGKTFGSLLGPHYVPVAKPELVTGRFNGHLSNCLLLQAEEAFWAGDRAAAGALKDLITNDDLVVEFKGLEAIRMRNYVRLFATSNEDWVVPAGLTARRFAVYDVGEAHLGDKAYFKAIAGELDNGGCAALLYYLLNFDLSKVDLRSVPKTKALLEQKLHSLDGEQAWWFGVLMNGELPGYMNEPRCCLRRSLFNHYLEETNRAGIRRKRIETLIGTFLKKYVPGLRRSERRGIGPIYEFPPLAECRAAFERIIQQEIDWPEQEDWRDNNAE